MLNCQGEFATLQHWPQLYEWIAHGFHTLTPLMQAVTALVDCMWFSSHTAHIHMPLAAIRVRAMGKLNLCGKGLERRLHNLHSVPAHVFQPFGYKLLLFFLKKDPIQQLLSLQLLAKHCHHNYICVFPPLVTWRSVHCTTTGCTKPQISVCRLRTTLKPCQLHTPF